MAASIALLLVFAAPTAGALGVNGLFTNFTGLLAGLTMPNTDGPPLSLPATAGALAVYGHLAICAWLLLRGRTSEGS
jgi:hypothetical protein